MGLQRKNMTALKMELIAYYSKSLCFAQQQDTLMLMPILNQTNFQQQK